MTENDAVKSLVAFPRLNLFGRKQIILDYKEVNRGNVLEILGKAMAIHEVNASDINYLWNYYRGNQPILSRVKDIRPEICNKVVENRANEIVSFKVGYLCGEPIQYVGRSSENGVADGVLRLNEYMFAEDKASQDQEIVEWDMICGTAYRMVLADPNGAEDDSPFEMYTLNPMEAFVAYSAELGNKPLMGVTYRDTDKGRVYSVYTDAELFKIVGNEITGSAPHAYGCVPIFEYPANHARLGSFEIVLPLLDAINNVASNRMDGMEQQIQAFLKFINCDIDKDGLDKLRELGAIKVKSPQGMTADVDVVKTDLDQGQSQTFKKDLYDAVLTICGMPNRNGGTSTSDTGAAVILRDGWSLAESRAKDSEHMFKKAEKQMLKLVLKICGELAGLGLKLKDIDMKFTRRNYEAIQSKSQVLCEMLKQPKIHPKLAFEHSGMFSDPESAYSMSEEYFKENAENWEPEAVNENETIREQETV